MSPFDINEVHIIPVRPTGEVQGEFDDELDLYNSALVYLLNDKNPFISVNLSISRIVFPITMDIWSRKIY